MALVWKDRVLETTTTTGTGTLTLAGAVTGYQTFAAVGDGLRSHRGSQRTSSGPPSFQSRPKCVLVNTELFGPIGDGGGCAIVSDEPATSPIPGLLRGSLPAYIAGFVHSVVVYSAERVFRRWGRTDIGEESRKGFNPPPAHRNSTPAVSGVRRTVSVSASDYHAVPRSPFFASGTLFGLAVHHIRRRRTFAVKTPATRRQPSDKVVGENGFFVPATAAAMPGRMPTDHAGITHDGQPPERLTCAVQEPWVTRDRAGLVHNDPVRLTNSIAIRRDFIAYVCGKRGR